MNSKSFIILFIAVQVVLIFAQIHKSSTFLRLSYEKQRQEKVLESLHERRNILARELELLKNRDAVKGYAIEQGMVPIDLKQIKRVSDLHDNKLSDQN